MDAPSPSAPADQDLPAIERLEMSMPRLLEAPRPAAPRADRAARVGLALSVVLALVGAVCAVGRSGDTTTATADRPAVAVHEPDPTTTTTSTTSTTHAPATLAPAGFHTVTGPGISLAVPDGWTTVNPADLHLSAARLRSIYPDMDPDLLQAASAAAEKGAIFVAVDMAGEGRGSSVNVLSVPAELPLDQMDDVVAGLRSSGLDVRNTTTFDHPLGRAVRISFAITVAGRTMEGLQFWLPVNGATYVITATAGPTDVAEKIARSFRLDHSSTA
jgi:hypothetical protein